MASASATSKVRREIQDLLGFNDYQDASGFNDWLSKVSKSNSLIKCYFQYPKLWVKLILKVANCLDLGSSSFLFESVCTAILNFFGPTACGQSSLAYIADKKPSKKGTSQIHFLVEKLCAAAAKVSLEVKSYYLVGKILNIIAHRQERILCFSKNSKLLLFLRGFEANKSESLLKKEIIFPLMSALLSVRAPSVRSTFLASSKWKSIMDKVSKGEPWADIPDLGTRLAMAYVAHKLPQYMFLIRSNEFPILIQLCLDVLTSKYRTSFDNSNVNFNYTKEQQGATGTHEKISMVQRNHARFILLNALSRPDQVQYTVNAIADICTFAENTIHFARANLEASSKFIGEEDKCGTLMVIEPALALLHEYLKDATIDLKEKLLEIAKTNDFESLLLELLLHVAENFYECGIPLSISILRIMHILSTNPLWEHCTGAKLDLKSKAFSVILKLATDDRCLEVSIPAIELLRNHGSSLQLLSLADDIRSAMLKGADKLALQKNSASKQTLESYNL